MCIFTGTNQNRYPVYKERSKYHRNIISVPWISTWIQFFTQQFVWAYLKHKHQQHQTYRNQKTISNSSVTYSFLNCYGPYKSHGRIIHLTYAIKKINSIQGNVKKPSDQEGPEEYRYVLVFIVLYDIFPCLISFSPLLCSMYIGYRTHSFFDLILSYSLQIRNERTTNADIICFLIISLCPSVNISDVFSKVSSFLN